MATFHEALKHKNRISPVLLKRAEVTAVGVGYADPNKPALGAGVIVYTHQKIVPSSMNSLKGTLAKAGSAVPIRFVHAGKFNSHAQSAKPKGAKAKLFTSRVRPVPGGVSIGRVNPAATGTAGLIVIKNNQLYVLSNNHVLIRDNSTSFTSTLQPGPADGGVASRDTIGRAFQFVRLIPGGVNFQDSAIAIPNANSLLNPRYQISSSGQLITVPGHLLSYPVGLQVMKSGRTTGFVRGTVEANNVDIRVSYGGTLGDLLFRNQSVIRGNNGPVSLPGDSGSVWLRASDRFAAALNFAGTPDGVRSISNPIGLVMSTYGLRVAIPAAGQSYKGGLIRGAAPIGNHAYVQPLTQQQRKRIRAILVKSR
ncbi:S1 family peptidase [Paenibacillus sp. HWE-109]|uniref:S1 family peptidase n=1 Tax=Paenibacillus sp. HWE-109 TaxID=1306526 RepID=UPI001EDF6742|nr:S1 family peptidase [Paenibacillus sp. HWE-109]UKS30354.1 S1 family peptidase [Paenibacillus sp. HWE-109]